MITLSLPVALVILYLIFILGYVGIAGWSFKYYSLNANSSSREVEAFKKQLHFPSSLIFRKNATILRQILGANFTSSDVNHARSQRILIVVVMSMFHVPIFIGMLSKNDFLDVLYCAIFLLTSIITIIQCMRFGHTLGAAK